MAIKAYKFRDIVEMQIFLSGGLIGGVQIPSDGIVGLVGQTLTFTSPSATTVTFVTANRANDALLLKDIKAQIETALTTAAILVHSIADCVAFVHPSATSAVALSASAEVAKTLLGFASGRASAGKVYGLVVGTPPALVTAYSMADNTHCILTNE